MYGIVFFSINLKILYYINKIFNEMQLKIPLLFLRKLTKYIILRFLGKSDLPKVRVF